MELAFHADDLLAGVPAKARFDLVYENLLNIPAGGEDDLEVGNIADSVLMILGRRPRPTVSPANATGR